jgi:formate hydrogenlyase subunit 6/NADH:ubiquinone oxidoreductase subunit I
MKLYLHMAYFQNIKRGIETTTKGLGLTLKHMWAARKTKGPLNVQDENYFKLSEGFVTLQYPHETISVPEIGRYQLDCEIDDCIVCDKCAKICPVDCIEIEAIKSPELIRTTSDGSPVRLHAAKFDIDMAKCCFCGLCTTVCPTECLTMNSEYDYSVFDVDLLNMAFSNLSEKEAQEKRDLYEQFVAEKEAAKAAKVVTETPKEENTSVFKPKVPSAFQPKANLEAKEDESREIIPKKPVFAPKKPVPLLSEEPKVEKPQDMVEKPRVVFAPKKPAILPLNSSETVVAESQKDESIESTPKAKFVPKKPVESTEATNTSVENSPKAFVPKKPMALADASKDEASLPKFIPTKPQMASEAGVESPTKPKFVPKKPVSSISEPDYSKTEDITKQETTAEAVITVNPATSPSPGFMPKNKPVESAENPPKPTVFIPKNKPQTSENTINKGKEENKPAKFIPKLKPKQ